MLSKSGQQKTIVDRPSTYQTFSRIRKKRLYSWWQEKETLPLTSPAMRWMGMNDIWVLALPTQHSTRQPRTLGLRLPRTQDYSTHRSTQYRKKINSVLVRTIIQRVKTQNPLSDTRHLQACTNFHFVWIPLEPPKKKDWRQSLAFSTQINIVLFKSGSQARKV